MKIIYIHCSLEYSTVNGHSYLTVWHAHITNNSDCCIWKYDKAPHPHFYPHVTD